MFQFTPTILDGVSILTLPAFDDQRGVFIKTFQDSLLKNAGIEFQLKESYFSVSKKSVIRGMHFQVPPQHHAKIVFCPFGRILDVIVDLRKEAATFGKFITVELSPENHKAVYIPPGFAHGFHSLEEGAITYYLVSSEHDKTCDKGILYDSFGMNWGVETPIISERDKSFPGLMDWESPF